jgi:hypothetical protein
MYESTLRLYTEEKFSDELSYEQAWQNFLNNLQLKLSAKKFNRLKDFIKYPLPVVNIGKGVLKDIYKVFDSMNSYFHVEYLNKQNQQKIEEILNDINVHEWLIHEGKEALKNEPNIIVLVDRDEFGIPYLVEVDTCRIIDVCVKEDSTCDYIAFIHSVRVDEISGKKIKRIGVYDDEYYRIFESQEGGEPVFVEEILHGVGYCPARMLLSKPLNSEDSFNREAPLAPVLSKLEEWQQFEIYKYYTDHYASFPIIERPEENCSVDGCENGIVKEYYTELVGDAEVQRHKSYECPSCAKRKVIGPGTEISIKPKSDKDDTDSSGIFKFISPEIDSLKYLDEKQKSLEVGIYIKTVGENEILKVQAVNEDQVEGSFEAKRNILMMWKVNFDKIYKWTVETIIYTYNPTIQASVHADFGTEFYLVTEEDLQNRFKTAKDSGMPSTEVDMIYRQLIETKYRGNPKKLERMKVLSLLDPMPYDTQDEAIAKFDKGVISQEDLAMKLNLISFANRFELENGSLVEFGKEIDFGKKIETIREIFKTYINVKPINEAEQV